VTIALRALAAVLLLAASPAVPQVTSDSDIVAVSGELEHHRMSNSLFHIDDFWMRVAPDTQFHRWLSQGIDREVSIILTRNPDSYGDRENVRILSGRLMHQTVPSESPVMHVLFLQDEETGTIGAVTFQTDNPVIARKFDPFDDRGVSIIIEIP
jgi:hypothetical protein